MGGKESPFFNSTFKIKLNLSFLSGSKVPVNVTEQTYLHYYHIIRRNSQQEQKKNTSNVVDHFPIYCI